MLRQLSNFSATSLWEQYEKVTLGKCDDTVCFVLDHNAVLDCYNAISLKQQSTSLNSDALA